MRMDGHHVLAMSSVLDRPVRASQLLASLNVLVSAAIPTRAVVPSHAILSPD